MRHTLFSHVIAVAVVVIMDPLHDRPILRSDFVLVSWSTPLLLVTPVPFLSASSLSL